MATQYIFSRWRSWAPYFQSLLRIVASLMFMMAGTAKLFAFPAGLPSNGGTVKLMSQLGLAGVLETFGGFLLLIGLFTRPIAFLVSGEMAIAFFQVHLPKSPWPTISNGVAPVLYCFIWLYISAAGAGPWSVDAKLRR
jgi:putative oxidoreductase